MGGELCRTRLQKCASEISHDLSERMSFPSSLLVVGASLPLPLPTSGGTCVERVSRLDILRFGREFFSQHRPVVITDSMEHWAAVSDPDRKWNQISYLKRRCAFRTVPIELGSQYTAEKWSQKLMTIVRNITTARCVVVTAVAGRVHRQSRRCQRLYLKRDGISGAARPAGPNTRTTK